MSVNTNFPFPDVLGNEFETSVHFEHTRKLPDPLLPGEFIDETYISFPQQGSNSLTSSPPSELDTGTQFLLNGFKYYDGSLGKDPGSERVELATPETTNPSELTLYIRVGELVLDRALREYIPKYNIDAENPIKGARVQRRVLDTFGNTWGCHDNYGYESSYYDQLVKTIGMPALKYFLISRPLLVGAGGITDDRFVFSQKTEYLDTVSRYAFSSRLFRPVKNSYETTGRIEISSSDYNTLDWPTDIRLGGVALLFTTELLGASGNIHDMAKELTNNKNIFDLARLLNSANIDENGDISLSDEQIRALDFQELVVDIAIDRLRTLGIEIPDSYLKIARNIQRMCNELKDSSSVKSVFNFADRAEWANRSSYIIKKAIREKTKGTNRKITDIRAMRDDLEYDATIYFVSGGHVQTQEAISDRIKRKGSVVDVIKPAKIAASYHVPPETRAKIRSRILKELVSSDREIFSVDWGIISAETTEGSTESTVLSNALSSTEQK